MNIHECGGAMWDAFLRDIVEHPDDLTPRLILADWLEEQAHPIQQARAEFIRLMVEGTDESMKRAHRMLQHCFPQWWLPEWAPPLRPYHYQPKSTRVKSEAQYNGCLTVVLHDFRGLSVTFRRGFVEKLLLPLSILEQYVGRLFTTCPLRKVDLSDREPVNGGPRAWCWYGQELRHNLQYVDMNWPDEDERALLPSPIFARLPSPRNLPEGQWWPSVEHVAHGYADAGEARDACSRAILAWGRELQGMPATEKKDHA